MDSQDSSSLPSLLDFLRIVRRRKWWLVACIIIGGAAAVGYSKTEPVRFTAQSTVLVQGMPLVSAANGITPQPLGLTAMATAVQLAQSAPIHAEVRHVTHINTPVTAAAIGTTNVLGLSVSASGPKKAMAVADAYAHEFVNYENALLDRRIHQVEGELKGRLKGLDSLITTLQGQLSSTSSGSSSNSGSNNTSTTAPSSQVVQGELQAAYIDEGVVQGDLEQLEAASTSNTNSPAQIVSFATRPGSESSPKTKRNAGIGLGAGLLLGLLLCVAVDSIDDRIRTKNNLEEVFGDIPTLGMIPRVPLWKTPDRPFLVSIASPQSVAAESYRALRTALQFVLLDKGMKRVLISSAIMGEGKTATTANLGVAMARAGNQVLVVSADLRRPRLGEFFECEEGTGLASIALGSATFEEAVQAVPGIRGLHFLGTGPVPPDPAEFLASRRVAAVMEEAGNRFDLVLIDCAPVIPVADTLAASDWADAILMVVRGDVTRRRHSRRALELLSTSNTDICGVIFNDSMRDDRGYRGYGRYRRYYGYGTYGTYGYGPEGARHRRDKKAETQPVAAVPSEPLSSSEAG